MIRLEKWSTVLVGGPYTAPEQLKMGLYGEVYNHPRFEDGTIIQINTVEHLDIGKRTATIEDGQSCELGEPDQEWVCFLRKKYGNKYVGKLYPN